MSEREKWREYFYPDTIKPVIYNGQKVGEYGIFRNFQNLKDELVLALVEDKTVIFNQEKAKQINGDFDLKHLQEINKTLFQDLYSWAGQPREVLMYKGNVAPENQFCKPVDFSKFANEIFTELKNSNYLANYQDDKQWFSIPKNCICNLIIYSFLS